MLLATLVACTLIIAVEFVENTRLPFGAVSDPTDLVLKPLGHGLSVAVGRH